MIDVCLFRSVDDWQVIRSVVEYFYSQILSKTQTFFKHALERFFGTTYFSSLFFSFGFKKQNM